MKTIKRDELKAILDRGEAITLLEALPEKYYSAGHLPGARNFPHDQVATLAPKLLGDKGANVVVYCASETCENSTLAARELEALGYGSVRVYVDGKKDWEAAGFPLER
ncbi:rhodanese-like domain-containing protein [Vulgatibacter sp.]|uniref:rhodanese-like domain-containing protein n=1 Tax=Vulgatibacter sp. TaxID=1971226 RepID=UPI003569A0E5